MFKWIKIAFLRPGELYTRVPQLKSVENFHGKNENVKSWKNVKQCKWRLGAHCYEKDTTISQ